MQLPLNGRNFLALAQLSDAVVIPPGGTRGEALQQAGPLPNVGGQRSGHNIYLLDGTKVTDELFNNLVINPSVDSIEEFKIQKSMYAAEFGGKASALINVVTRAGANAFRGSAFEFHRDDAFDSPNYFRPIGAPVPPLRQDQFGGTLGGPLRRNRSFFFGSFEGLRMKRSLTRTFSVPTAAVRAGNFAGLGPICDPLDDSDDGRVRAFANNQIPAGRIDPIAAALLQHVPAATPAASTQNLTAVEEQDRDLNQFSLRLDHQLTASDQLLARFSTFDADETQPFGTSTLQESLVPGFGRSLTTRTRNLVASHTRVVRHVAVERAPLRMDDRGRRPDQPEPRQHVRPGRRTARRHHRPARHGISAGLDRRALQHVRRSHRSSRLATTSTSSCSTTSRSIAARTG